MRSIFKYCYLAYLIFCFGSISTHAAGERLLPTSLSIPDSSLIPRYVKIALMADVPSVSMTIEAPYEVRTIGDRTIGQSQSRFNGVIRPAKDGIQVGSNVYQIRTLILDNAGRFFEINKRQYGGRIRIIWRSERSIAVVNEIELEEYLKGVLPLEVNSTWSEESLKAHAVVSRTFALFKTLEKQDRDFTLQDTVLGQVYGGALFHKGPTDAAVDATRGEIMTSNGKIFPAYFHSCCGGQTAQADQIWAIEPNPVLKSVVCPFCRAAKRYQWSFSMPIYSLQKMMQENGYSAKNIENIVFADRDVSGRARKVVIQYENSQAVLSADEFRSMIGYDRLFSLKTDAKIQGDKVYFSGFGWGHGIGFCQWGSKRQADLGKGYRDILSFYFPGHELKKVYIGTQPGFLSRMADRLAELKESR